MDWSIGDARTSQLVVVYSVVAGFAFILFLVLRRTEGGALEYEVPIPEQCQPGWFVEVEPLKKPSLQVLGSTAIQCYCPATGKPLGWINPATEGDIDRVVAEAQVAQLQWARTTFAQRRKVLKTMLNYVLKHQQEIAIAACLDSGKTKVDASLGEILVTAEKLKWTIANGEKALKPERRSRNLIMIYKNNEVRWEPLGVVAACVSWNYPFHNLLNPIISSIFAGNAIVVKTSEQTAWSASYFTSIVQNALTACKHSPALVQSVVCWPSVAPHLISHPSISHVTFIGSRPVAHHVAASAAKSLTPVCAELGGKDAAIVLDDVKDLNKLVSILLRGVFQSAGQNCIGIERVIATPKAYEQLLHRSALVSTIKALRVGSALDEEEEVDVGACISPSGFDRLEHLIEDAVSRGADLICGGTRYNHPDWPEGHYFKPTLLAGVTREMPIAQLELFAPIFVLMRAESVNDAIAMTNSTPYGLGCSVFGENAEDLETVTREVKVGMVAVNDFASYYMCSLPFGGMRGSGYGRFGGAEGLRSLCNVKSVCKDRWPLVSTSIPPRLDYPSRRDEGSKAEKDAKRKGWEFACGIVGVVYGMNWRDRVKAVGNITKNA